MKKIYFLVIGIVLLSCSNSSIQKLSDEEVINLIFSNAKSSSESYQNLKYLVEKYPKRLACYPNGIEAAKWAKGVMEQMGLENVFLQKATVMNWKRGSQETGTIKSKDKSIDVNVCALGRGISTEKNGLEAEVVEVNGLDDLDNYEKKQLEGKIVFFNQAMNPNLENPFQAYGEAAGQRFVGPILAAEHGAVGAVIRSLTTSIDEFPHTGTTRKASADETVPSVCIATKDANLLSNMLKQNPHLKFYFKTSCKNMPDTVAYNAIGEITGSEFPHEYIVVGGHIDAWDNSPGAHDDGGGCMQAIEVLRILKEIGYKPKHSIRAVMYIDEEISQGGGKAYAEQAKHNGEKHILAIESDRGVTAPRGFTIDANDEMIKKIESYKELFKPYNIRVFDKGYGGVDIGPLKDLGTPVLGLDVEAKDYFNWHHSANDTFGHVNREDMQKGAATMAALIFLADKYGL